MILTDDRREWNGEFCKKYAYGCGILGPPGGSGVEAAFVSARRITSMIFDRF
jgi:hypothetical protein